MYEMIMDLPLFKGVGKDQVSLFLEKTNIGFQNYAPGEIMADLGDPVRMVRFVISGEISLVHPLAEAGITVEEQTGFGKVIGADRLFGLATGYPYKAVAVTPTSIMEFSKEQYVNLLHSDRIYMLNFFNYLSLRAQRPVDSTMTYCRGNIDARLAQLLSIMTEPAAHHVVVKGTEDALARYCSASQQQVREWKERMETRNLIRYDSDTIWILSRRQFLDTVK
jgi:CRP-like cAMP-binding protein